MVIARKYRASSEVLTHNHPVYQDKWTQMLSRADMILMPDGSGPREESVKEKKVIPPERHRLHFSIPLSSCEESDPYYGGESKEESFGEVKDTGIGRDPVKTVAKPAPSVLLVKPLKEDVLEDVRQEVILKREEKVAELRSVPPIATIAALGPKIMNDPSLCPTPPQDKTKRRRRSSTALPDWWKQCVAEDRERRARRATWNGTSSTKESMIHAVNNRRSLLAKKVSSASLLSGVYTAPQPRLGSINRQLSFESTSSKESSATPDPKPEIKAPDATPSEGLWTKGSSLMSLVAGMFPSPQTDLMAVPELTSEVSDLALASEGSLMKKGGGLGVVWTALLGAIILAMAVSMG